jgi:hypothetical protein
MTPEEYKHGRGSFWMQFICGAILGIFFGIMLWREYAGSFAVGVMLLLGAVGLSAIAAGFWGDRFWEALIRFFGWTGKR